MQQAVKNDLPALQKERQLHSRIFCAVMLLVVLLTRSQMPHRWVLFEIMQWLGFCLIVAGASGRIYCSLFIGGRKNSSLITDGPYSVVRNPLYVFSFLALAGVGLMSGSIVITACLCGAFYYYYPEVVLKEERYMLMAHGEAFQRYQARVPRWYPDLSLWSEPEAVEVMPRFVRKTAYDASVFLLAIPFYWMVNLLHVKHVLPVLFLLP